MYVLDHHDRLLKYLVILFVNYALRKLKKNNMKWSSLGPSVLLCIQDRLTALLNL